MKNHSHTAARKARSLYSCSHQGMLSTLSVELGGFPFGSVTALAKDQAGRPLILISRIAEHTRNIRADSRVSLMLIENGEDVQAQGRLTLAGHALPVPPADQEDAAQRYFRRFPHAQEHRRAHDFDLYRIEPVRVRYIGGFGQIHWLEPREVCLPNPFSAAVEGGMAAHMNKDHADALRNYCRMFGVEANHETPRLAAVDQEGFDLMVGKRFLRIEFDAPVQSPDEVRKAMVALALRAREVGLRPA